MRHITICGFSPGSSGMIVLQRDQRLRRAPPSRAPWRNTAARSGMFSQVDVLPDIQLGPVGKRENADALALVDAAVVEVPQLRPLILRVPLAERVAEGVDALLGARLLLVAPRAAESRVEAALGERVQQRAGLQQAAALLRAQAERIGAVVDRLLDWCGRSARAPISLVKRSRNSIISRNL